MTMNRIPSSQLRGSIFQKHGIQTFLKSTMHISALWGFFGSAASVLLGSPINSIPNAEAVIS